MTMHRPLPPIEAGLSGRDRSGRGRESLDLLLLGTGTVGGRLLEILGERIPALGGQGVDLTLCAIAQADSMLWDPRGIEPATWAVRLGQEGVPMDLDGLLAWVREQGLRRPVLVDCTTSEALAGRTGEILAAGIHVVTANKKANSGSQAAYDALRERAVAGGVQFRYETNVGAGLPVIETLRGLRAGGDRVREVEGILSGSLSFILGRLSEGMRFSCAVAEAREQGFTEPDPRDDLSGADVGRKLLILAREMGQRLEPSEIVVEPLLPPGFGVGLDVPGFLACLSELDGPFEGRLAPLRAEGKVLRYVGSATSGGCRVGLVALEATHPLASVQGGENAIAFATDFYQPRPLVVRGYGAGASVTAAGVLTDILRLVPA